MTDYPAPSPFHQNPPRDVRFTIEETGIWGYINNRRFVYTEGGSRMKNVKHRPLIGRIYCDCSAWVTYCYSWAGAKDPNGLNFDGEGYTGTLLRNGTSITVNQALGGDVVVFGPGDGVHCALILTAGKDPLCSSMGTQGQPVKARVSEMLNLGEPRYLRFSTLAR